MNDQLQKAAEDYTPFGEEWEKEINKLPKKFIIDMLRKANQKRQSVEEEYATWRLSQLPPVEEYEPYFGWCDVEGCENEGCSGGNAWRKWGYWTVCYKHAQEYRDGLPIPKMKQKSIDRENSRGEDGKLPITTY